MRTGCYRLSERERAIVGLVKLGIADWDIRGILRDARTLARLAEAQCNGDWPADNGDSRAVECQECGCYWRNLPNDGPGRASKRLCDDCRAAARINARIRPYAPQGIGVELAGDPRGYVVKVWGPGPGGYLTEVGIA